MDNVIFMIESEDEMIKRVRFFNVKGSMRTVDVSALNLKRGCVDDEKLQRIVDVSEHKAEVMANV